MKQKTKILLQKIGVVIGAIAILYGIYLILNTLNII